MVTIYYCPSLPLEVTKPLRTLGNSKKLLNLSDSANVPTVSNHAVFLSNIYLRLELKGLLGNMVTNRFGFDEVTVVRTNFSYYDVQFLPSDVALVEILKKYCLTKCG